MEVVDAADKGFIDDDDNDTEGKLAWIYLSVQTC